MTSPFKIRKLQAFSAVVLSKDLDVLRRSREAVKDLPSVASTDSVLIAYDNAEWLAAMNRRLRFRPPKQRLAQRSGSAMRPINTPSGA